MSFWEWRQQGTRLVGPIERLVTRAMWIGLGAWALYALISRL